MPDKTLNTALVLSKARLMAESCPECQKSRQTIRLVDLIIEDIRTGSWCDIEQVKYLIAEAAKLGYKGAVEVTGFSYYSITRTVQRYKVDLLNYVSEELVQAIQDNDIKKAVKVYSKRVFDACADRMLNVLLVLNTDTDKFVESEQSRKNRSDILRDSSRGSEFLKRDIEVKPVWYSFEELREFEDELYQCSNTTLLNLFAGLLGRPCFERAQDVYKWCEVEESTELFWKLWFILKNRGIDDYKVQALYDRISAYLLD